MSATIDEQIGSILELIDATRCGKRFKPSEISALIGCWYDALESLSALRDHATTLKREMQRETEISDEEAFGAIIYNAVRAREAGQ